MKVGDLVQFYSDESDFAGQVGIVMGLSHCKSYGPQVRVQWPGVECYVRYSARQLVVVT